MKRPRRKRLEKNLVKMAIDILEDEIDPQFGRRRHLKRLGIHEQQYNNYYKQLVKTIDYLEELRGSYKNSLRDLLVDFFTAVYTRFKEFGRTPTLTNLSPSTSNRVAFEEFTHKFTADNMEEYWISELTEAPEIIHVPVIPEDIDTDPSFIEV